MSARAAASRVGRCPGAWRPMPSGDGLILRVKPRGGRLSREQGLGIAEAAARFGNGALDLTSRANLQIRGVRETTLDGLTAVLDRLGLLDASPEAEARRNVVASPLAGLDPTAAFDIRPAVAALEDRLTAAASLAGLPQKFGFAVSDGGAFPLGDVPADVRVAAERDGDGRPSFAVRLDGDEDRVAVCSEAALPAVAVQLARAFVDGCRERSDLDRMRDLVARIGAAAVFAAAGVTSIRRPARQPASAGHRVGSFLLSVIASEAKPCSPPCPQPGSLRRLAPRHDESRVIGFGAPFGRLDVAQLDLVARNSAELRLTPWRVLMVPSLDRDVAERLAASCAAAGLIVDPGDPRLRVAACTGAPGCRRGTTPTLGDAARWAPLLPRETGIALHVSGCGKGCAHPGPAALTLVGRDGRYDVILDGRPGDAPVALALDAAEVRRLLRTTFAPDPGP